MTKPKDLVKIRTVRFVLTMVFMAAGFVVVVAQSTVPQFDATILPSLEKLTARDDVDRIQRQLGDLENKSLKETRANKDQYCDALFNFVVFRYRLHRASPTLPPAPAVDTPAAKEWRAFLELLDKNVLRAEDLFADGEKACSSIISKPTISYLMAKFANTWLFDNIRAGAQRFVLPIDRPRLEKRADQNLTDYSLVLKEFRSWEDKSWIDPVLLLYSYANALVRRDEFETAEPLLSECLIIASKKYGTDSPILLPILRLLAGIAGVAGDQSEHDRFTAWTRRIDASGKDQDIVFDLIFRTTTDSKPALTVEKMILIAGPRDETKGAPKPDVYRNTPVLANEAVDLPFSPGQDLRGDNRIPLFRDHKQYRVSSYITVDESGDVSKADVQSNNSKIRDQVSKIVTSLKFRPLTYKGRATPMNGIVQIWVRYDYN